MQSQEVTAGLAAMAADPAIGSRRIAVVLTSALQRIQARRAAPGYGFFATRAEALAWLHGDDADGSTRVTRKW